MQEDLVSFSYEELKDATKSAIFKLVSKKYYDIDELKNWFYENEIIERETIKYVFEENDFSDFWEIYYIVKTILKLKTKEEEIKSCLNKFQETKNNKVENKIITFLIEYETLIYSFSLPKFYNYNNKYLKTSKDLNILINKNELKNLTKFDKEVVKTYRNYLEKFYSKSLNEGNKKHINFLSFHINQNYE